jgi:hypothetical protein
MTPTIRKISQYAMMSTVIFVLIHSDFGCSANAQAQRKTSSPKQKTDLQTGIQQEAKKVAALPEKDKATLGAGIRSLDRAVRMVEITGLRKGLPTDDFGLTEKTESEKFEALLQQVRPAWETLPANSYLKRLIVSAFMALNDATMVEGFIKRDMINETVLGIIDKYKLRNSPTALVGSKILRLAITDINLAVLIAQRAGLMEPK